MNMLQLSYTGFVVLGNLTLFAVMYLLLKAVMEIPDPAAVGAAVVFALTVTDL
jgi:hypothetical protein